MKIAYKHLLNRLESDPSIDELSKKLLQLGHENKVINNIFDIEFTPNRGDCLSIDGLIRDLSVFYNIKKRPKIFEGDFDPLSINFTNHDHNACNNISFLKIDIDNKESQYKGCLLDYFKEFDIKKNNLFTDISNYISYETGQPTHCFDLNKLENDIVFKNDFCESEFDTLLGKKINLTGKNATFEQNNQIISLAGVMGGMATSCSDDTHSALIECAYFNPEEIIGKTQKYDIQSEAAYKFERGVDPLCHDYILRRFVNIVEENAIVKNLEIYQKIFKPYLPKEINVDFKLLNKIIGINLCDEDYLKHFKKLGFSYSKNNLEIPSYRSDIQNNNDLAEEITRVIGYDNIQPIKIKLPKKNFKNNNENEIKIKGYLVKNGFYEILNNPFIDEYNENSIIVINPLDINKNIIRNDLKKSLIEKLIFNERRQKDSVKLFEISNLYKYDGKKVIETKKLGLIASGRVDKNYEDFSKKIDEKYMKNILHYIKADQLEIQNIPRNTLNSKNKDNVFYCEFDLCDVDIKFIENSNISSPPKNYIKYKNISEYPSSIRDLSFLVTSNESLHRLENLMLNLSNSLIKEIFIFDFYQNKETNHLKIGFRIVFQSFDRTIQDLDVQNILNDIIDKSLSIKNVEIPGLIRWQRKKLLKYCRAT